MEMENLFTKLMNKIKGKTEVESKKVKPNPDWFGQKPLYNHMENKKCDDCKRLFKRYKMRILRKSILKEELFGGASFGNINIKVERAMARIFGLEPDKAINKILICNDCRILRGLKEN